MFVSENFELKSCVMLNKDKIRKEVGGKMGMGSESIGLLEDDQCAEKMKAEIRKTEIEWAHRYKP